MTSTATWDLDFDLVCIGSGIGGCAAAITAHALGLRPAILEKAALVGGVTAYSYGEVWVAGNHLESARGISDSVESGIRYVHMLGMGYEVDEMVEAYARTAPLALRFFEEHAGVPWKIIDGFADYYIPAADSLEEGRFLEVEPFPATSLGDWQSRVRTSPHTPYGMTHEDMFGQGGAANLRNWDFSMMGERLERDERCLGPGLAGWFVKGVLDRDIPVYTSTRVEELIADGGRVVGVRATGEDGELRVKAHRGVLIATGGYDWDKTMPKVYDRRPEFVSAAPPTITGDHIRFAGRLGAKIVQVPEIPALGFHLPGEEQDGEPLWRISLTEAGLPHSILVNPSGRRFADESFYRSVGNALEAIDGGRLCHANYPVWIILDSQYLQKYPFGSVLPGQEIPPETAVKANSLAELAHAIGVDADNLRDEVERFNHFARAGVDADFGRGTRAWSIRMCGDLAHGPNPSLGTLEQAPFYGVRLTMIGAGIASTGLAADPDARVQNYDDKPIEGLYVTGNAMAMTDVGGGYQSGMANGRGMVFGYLAAHHAAGRRSPRVEPDRAVAASA